MFNLWLSAVQGLGYKFIAMPLVMNISYDSTDSHVYVQRKMK